MNSFSRKSVATHRKMIPRSCIAIRSNYGAKSCITPPVSHTAKQAIKHRQLKENCNASVSVFWGSGIGCVVRGASALETDAGGAGLK